MNLRALRPPPSLILGTTGPRLFGRFVRLPLAQAGTHMHVIGKSGSGKSRFLAGLCLELLRNNRPCILIDPHGDLARLLLGYLTAAGAYDRPPPGHRTRRQDPFERLIYLDLPAAERAGRYLPLNVLAHRRTSPHTLGSNIVEAMHRAWPALGGGVAPRFDKLVAFGTKVLVSAGLSLPALYPFLTDKAFRDRLLPAEPDPDIAALWHGWFDRLPPKLQLEYADSTLSRISLLSYAPVLKHSLSQPDLALDFREILDRGTSVIINLAVEDAQARRLLGCLLTVFAELGALSRADQPPEARAGSTHLILDEFSQFTAQSEEALTRFLSETRKFGLFAVMAHQNWSQADARLRGALQNVGAEIVLQLGAEDAAYSARMLARVETKTVRQALTDDTAESAGMAEQFEGWKQAIMDLGTGEAFLRLQRGPATRLRARPVPNPTVDPGKLAAVEAAYLDRYFRPPPPPAAPIAPGVTAVRRRVPRAHPASQPLEVRLERR